MNLICVFVCVTYMNEFKSHWVTHSYDLVPHIFSDKSNMLETSMYVRTKQIILKNTNLLVD